jgi:hypothetical protein
MQKDILCKVFIARGTNSDLDGERLVCGDKYSFLYSNKEKNIYQQLVPCRPVYRYADDTDDCEDFEGVWVEDGFLYPEKEEEREISYSPGKHIRTLSVSFHFYEITIVELEDILQCSIKDTKTNKVLMSCYKDKIHMGSLKSFAETCKDSTDAIEFTELLERLK